MSGRNGQCGQLWIGIWQSAMGIKQRIMRNKTCADLSEQRHNYTHLWNETMSLRGKFIMLSTFRWAQSIPVYSSAHLSKKFWNVLRDQFLKKNCFKTSRLASLLFAWYISYQGTVELFNSSVVMIVVMVDRDLAAGSSLVGLKLWLTFGRDVLLTWLAVSSQTACL